MLTIVFCKLPSCGTFGVVYVQSSLFVNVFMHIALFVVKHCVQYISLYMQCFLLSVILSLWNEHDLLSMFNPLCYKVLCMKLDDEMRVETHDQRKSSMVEKFAT